MKKKSNKTYDSKTQNSEIALKENKELKEKLEDIIFLHEKMRGSYFGDSPGNARTRRWYENKHSQITKFDYQGDAYEVIQCTMCSCRHIYYSICYKKNDEIIKADIRLIKKFLKAISA